MKCNPSKCNELVFQKTRRLRAFPWDAWVYELLPKDKMINSHSNTSMISPEDWAKKSRYTFGTSSISL